jgi:hypothetical protein
MKRHAIILGVGLLAGGGIGYALGVRQTALAQLSTAGERPQPCLDAAPRSTGATPAPADRTTAPEPAAGAANDRARIADWLAAQGPMRDWSEINRCLIRWAKTDPWAVLAFVDQADRFPERTNALAVPLSLIGRTTPTAAADWLRAHVPESARKELATQVVAIISDENPREALALARADEIPVEPSTVGYVLGCLARQDPTEAAALLSTLAAANRTNAAEMIGSTWAERDAESALLWCESLRGQPGDDQAARGVLLELATRNATTLGEALTRLQPSAETTECVVRMLAATDAPQALLLAANLPAAQQPAAAKALAETALGSAPDRVAARARAALPVSEFSSVLADGWQEWRRSDRPAAEAWANNLTDPALRGVIANFKLQEIANGEPELFLSSLTTLPASSTERTAVEAALSSLPADAAARWIAAQPDAVDPAFAARTAANYFQADREAASRWAHSLPPGTARDRALASTALAWSETGDPTTATVTADTIADPRLQTSTRFQIFNTLCQQDRPGALRWLARQPLSAEIRTNWEILATAATTPAASTFEHSD